MCASQQCQSSASSQQALAELHYKSTSPPVSTCTAKLYPTAANRSSSNTFAVSGHQGRAAHLQYRATPTIIPMMIPTTAGIGMELTGRPALTPAMKMTASSPSRSVVVKARMKMPHLPFLVFTYTHQRNMSEAAAANTFDEHDVHLVLKCWMSDEPYETAVPAPAPTAAATLSWQAQTCIKCHVPSKQASKRLLTAAVTAAVLPKQCCAGAQIHLQASGCMPQCAGDKDTSERCVTPRTPIAGFTQRLIFYPALCHTGTACVQSMQKMLMHILL